MNWREAIRMSRTKKAKRSDDGVRFNWIVLEDGKGEKYDVEFRTLCYLTPVERETWIDWEPDDPHDAVTLLADLA